MITETQLGLYLLINAMVTLFNFIMVWVLIRWADSSQKEAEK